MKMKVIKDGVVRRPNHIPKDELKRENIPSILERVSRIHEAATRLESTIDGMHRSMHGAGSTASDEEKSHVITLEDTSNDVLQVLARVEQKLNTFREKIYGS